MSRAEDVSTLFRRFGGNAETYQEIVAMEQVDAAVSKWPMLDQIRVQIHPSAPSVHLADMARQERVRQAIPEPVHPVPVEPVAAEPVHVQPAPEVPTPAPVAEPVVASAASPLATVAVVPQPPAVPLVQPVAVAAPAELPVPVVVTPVVEPSVSVASDAADLKSMFHRMLPQRPAAQPASPPHPIKRLVKW